MYKLILGALISAIFYYTSAEAAGRRLNIADSLQIKVLNQPELDTQVRISSDGTISFPYVGRIKAVGLSEDQLSEKLRSLLVKSDVVKKPEIVISLLSAGAQITVQGAVNTPGAVSLDRDLTLPEALSKAGGLSPGAGAVILRRRIGKSVSVNRYDGRGVLSGEARGAEISLRDGDQIFVEEAPIFFLYGYVAKPGQYVLARALTLQQALASAGGLTELGSDWRIEVKRKREDGSTVVERMSMDDEVRPNDTIIVNERIF